MVDVTERWRAVTGYDGLYWVSDLGQVKSFHAGRGKGKRGGLLRPGLSSGKRTVVLCKDGTKRTRLVAHLVLEEFVGPRPPGQEARHGRAGPQDDSLPNLCWGTPAENQGPDRVRDGTSNRGERQGQSRLTREIVTECRRRYAAGEPMKVLTARYGVSLSAMSQAVSGRSWAWLPGAVPVDPARHGRCGTSHPAARLTPEIVRAARRRYAAGERLRDLVAEYGVAQGTLQNAIRARTWKDI